LIAPLRGFRTIHSDVIVAFVTLVACADDDSGGADVDSEELEGLVIERASGHTDPLVDLDYRNPAPSGAGHSPYWPTVLRWRRRAGPGRLVQLGRRTADTTNAAVVVRH
jgi:hypothetical protein